MIATFTPSCAKGTVCAPPSKSMAHRYLICAALANNTSTIKNIDFSQDVLATLDCISALGGTYVIDGNCVQITGCPDIRSLDKSTFECRESGSTLRFFLALGMLSPSVKTYHGSTTLLSRPQSVYTDICNNLGIRFEISQNSIELEGCLQATDYSIAGNISSQFITGLLFALPLLNGDSTIRLIPPVESASYIDMTLLALKQFGINIEKNDDYTYTVKGNQKYVSTNITVEGDYSNAAFLDGFNLLNGNVDVTGLIDNSLQGDSIYKKHYNTLSNCDNPCIDISDCPDLGPVLMALAAAGNGAHFTGTQRLQYKESNRGVAMSEELNKLGIKCELKEDSILVKKGVLTAPTVTLHGHNDHRIVMALSLLLSCYGGSIDDAQAVNKSYPGFWDDIKKLGIEVHINGMDK